MEIQLAKMMVALLFIAQPLFAQGGVRDTTLDLSQLANGSRWAVFNRKASAYEDNKVKNGVFLNAKLGQGVAWLPSFELTKGVIEVDVKGKNVPQQSFVGLAFHGSEIGNYEAIYLRPFNFRAETEAGRSHSIQYIAHPSHEWRRLRAQHPGQYEAEIKPAPDPDDWIHLRVELNGPTVRAFINNASEPALEVDRIGAKEGGWIGLWVGHNSDGTFANLNVSPK